jgi:streptogramin lyase
VPVSSELAVGSEFAGHRIEAEAGAGGMGVVYRATHLLLERTVALKLIAPGLAANPAFRSRFEREWRLLAALEHPNVIPIYEAGEVDGRPYLSMRWVSGGDLASRLRGTTGLDPAVALDVLSQVAAALDAAHARGVIHRDVKPANVLLEGEHAWLTDFGAGKDLAARDTRTAAGHWLGTVDYVAPELLDGAPATAAADVYSLGCVLYECLTGRVPFPRETEVATLWAHRHDAPPSTTGPVDPALHRALAKDPADRPACAGELIRAARAALAEPPPGAQTQPGPLSVAMRHKGAPSGGAETSGLADRRYSPVSHPAPPTAAPAAGAATSSPAAVRRALAAAGLAILIIAAVAALALHGHAQPNRAATPPPPLVDHISLGAHATAGRLAADPGFAYVLDPVHRQIVKVVSSSRQLGGRIKLPSPPHDVSLSPDGHHLWVTMEGHELADVDLLKGGKPKVVHLDIEGRYVAAMDDSVVVLSPSDFGGKLQRIDPATHQVAGPPLKLGGAPTDLDAYADRAVESLALPPMLVRFDSDVRTYKHVPIPTDGIPAELLIDGRGNGWVTDSETNRVVRFDPLTGKAIGKPVKVAAKPDGIASDGDDVWVASRSGSVQRFSAKTGKPVGPAVKTGPLAGDIAVSAGVVWAEGTSDVVRIEPRGT